MVQVGEGKAREGTRHFTIPEIRGNTNGDLDSSLK